MAAAIAARPTASFWCAASGSQGSIQPPTTENRNSSTQRCTLRSSVAATARLTDDFPTPDAPVTTSRPSTDVSVELQRRVLHQLLPLVGGVDGADGARLRAHHHRLRARAVAPVAHALEQVAVADAGGAEEHVVARHEIVAREHLVEVVAGVERGLLLFVVARVQPTEHLAAHALERSCGDDTFRRSTDAEE